MEDIKNRLLESIDIDEIEGYLRAIGSFDRLSASKGEGEALDYIGGRLGEAGVENELSFHQAYISDPISASLSYSIDGQEHLVKAKTRSFSASLPQGVSGEIVHLNQEDFTSDILEFRLKEDHFPLDLKNKLVLSDVDSPLALLEIEKRGGLGLIQYWKGEEDLIHEGAFNPMWGMANSFDLAYYPKLPVVAISGPSGQEILSCLGQGSLVGSLTTDLNTRVADLPFLEARIMPRGVEKFILVGSHIDSWHYGLTDNGTGNALGLYLALRLNELREDLKLGLKIVFWPGHSNGRYAGSSIYARNNYDELRRNCLAYVNIDMPGLLGAQDYRAIACGPDLYRRLRDNIEKVTGQKGHYVKAPRSWDQSFLNLGLSPYLVWASRLAPEDKNRTGQGFMPFWWHTEEDLLAYYSREVLEMDTRVYLYCLLDLLEAGPRAFELVDLLDEIERSLVYLESNYGNILSLEDILLRLEGIRASLVLREDLDSQLLLDLVKILNQIYYCSRPSYLQDYSLDYGPLPGLRGLKIFNKYRSPLKRLVLLEDLYSQKNRILESLLVIERLLGPGS